MKNFQKRERQSLAFGNRVRRLVRQYMVDLTRSEGTTPTTVYESHSFMESEMRQIRGAIFNLKIWLEGWRAKGAAAYLTLFLLASGGAMNVHQTSWSSLASPWSVRNDISAAYARARALGQSWFGAVDHYMGAPYAADHKFGFPPEIIQSTMTRILAHAFGDPFVAVNLLYILGYGLTAISAFWLCRRLKINGILGSALSLSYAWLPYNFIRMDYGHTSLASYFMLPIGTWILIQEFQIMRDKDFKKQSSRKQLVHTVLIAVLVGASGTYYALYFSLLMFAIIPIAYTTTNGWESRFTATARVITLSVSFMIPSVLQQFWANVFRTESQSVTRSVSESIRFGGSITRLLVPGGPPLSTTGSSVIPFEEFEWTVTPLLVSLGFWVILLTASLAMSRPTKSGANTNQSAILFISFWALLLYTTSGLGLIFAGFVSPMFRCWNRLSVFLSLFSLLFIGLRIGDVRIKILKQLCVATVCLMALSQLVNVHEIRIGKEPDIQAVQDANSLKSTALQVEGMVTPGCRILQLPIVEAMGAKNVNEITPASQYWLPLFSPNLKWSFGAAAGTTAGNYWPSVAARGGKALYEAAKVHGFCGAVFDRRGYVSDSEFFDNVAEFEGFAQNQQIDVGSRMRFVRISINK
jgi:phosphoglycerol transferase